MVEPVAPDTLPALRREIDAVDAGLIDLLGKRFDIVQRVIVVKQRDGLPANIPERVEDVVRAARALAGEAGLPQDLVETLWRSMISWTIDYEDSHLARSS
jgi:isochorismate pyruvate lyase